MSAFNVRLAGEDDVEQLCQLLGQLFAQEAEFSPAPELQAKGLLLILKGQDVGRVLLAESDGQIIGMINLLYTVSTALGGRVALLEDMVVDGSFRGLGVGRRLLNAGLDQARADGCLRVTLLTDQDNELAHSFYEGNGFVRSPMIPFRRFLGND
jgi:GNAT superfamily N-acetyltransferase